MPDGMGCRQAMFLVFLREMPPDGVRRFGRWRREYGLLASLLVAKR
jgi:hypothetical protein